jgi:NAD-dependent dihydropyrimidine dehydrogenase PreA subunit
MSGQASGKVEINPERCTGCGLCIESCPAKGLKLSPARNHFGVHFVQRQMEICSDCGTCYYFCPQPGVITVSRMYGHDSTVCDGPAA